MRANCKSTNRSPPPRRGNIFGRVLQLPHDTVFDDGCLEFGYYFHYLLKSEDIISMIISASLCFGLPVLVTGRD